MPRADWKIGAIILATLLSASLAWSGPDPDLIPLPNSITVRDTTYSVVQRDSLPDEFTSAVPIAFRFRGKRPIDVLAPSVRYWLEGSEFLRSPDGQSALPFTGSAPFVGYINLVRGEFVTYKDVFPPTGEEKGKGGPTRYEWTAFLDERLAAAPQLLLFVHRWNRETKTFSSHRVIIPCDAPERIRVEPMRSVVERVCARAEKEVLCVVDDGRDRTWARLATDTWELIAKGKPRPQDGHIGRVVYSPDQREIYAVFSSAGLVVFDAANGVEKAHFGRAGRYVNAFSLGATFDPGGTVAAVSTPYASELTIIDVKSRRILSRYKTPVPLSGIIFDGKERKAYAQKTFLPYE